MAKAMTNQELSELKVTLKIYIRIILYIDNLFIIKSRNLESSEEENINDALKQYGMFRKASDQVNSHSFAQFMLEQWFKNVCSDTNPSKCGEYDEFSKLFREIKLSDLDIEEFQKKLFEILNVINSRITQTTKVKAMKEELTKLINGLNSVNKDEDIKKIIDDIKKLMEQGKNEGGQSLMSEQELNNLLKDIFVKEVQQNPDLVKLNINVNTSTPPWLGTEEYKNNRLAGQRLEKAKAEEERLAEKAEQERIAAEKARIAAEDAEKARKVDEERLAKAEQEIAAFKALKEATEQARIAKEKVAAKKAAEDAAAEKAAEDAAAEKAAEDAAAEKAAQEKAAAEKAAQEKAAAEKAAQEKAAQEKAAAEKAAQEKAAAEKAAQEKAAAEKAAQEKAAQEKAAQEKAAAEKAAQEKAAQEKAAQEKTAAEERARIELEERLKKEAKQEDEARKAKEAADKAATKIQVRARARKQAAAEKAAARIAEEERLAKKAKAATKIQSRARKQAAAKEAARIAAQDKAAQEKAAQEKAAQEEEAAIEEAKKAEEKKNINELKRKLSELQNYIKISIPNHHASPTKNTIIPLLKNLLDKFSKLPKRIKSDSLLTDYKNTVSAISRSDPNMLRDILQNFDTISNNTTIEDKLSKDEKMLKELLIKKIKKPIIYNILFKAINVIRETIEKYITDKKTIPDKLFNIETNIEHAIGTTIKTENIYKISDVEIEKIKKLFKNMINDSSKYGKESISGEINNIIDYNYETIKDEYDSLFPNFPDNSTQKNRPQSQKTKTRRRR